MRIVFIGSGAIGIPAMHLLRESPEHELVGIVTQPDKPVGRKQIITPPPIKAAAQNCPVLQPPRIKHKEAIDAIRALAPELIVVMAYGQILLRTVLEIPKLGCLNLHASLLPRWRGAAPIQATIAAGDAETGITVMYMDEGLDTGDILLQRDIKVAREETAGSLHDRLAQLAPEALHDALVLLGSGNAPRTPQDNARATYAPKLERENGRIDWSERAEVIERKIRAYNPWPAAFTTFNERILKIFRAEIVSEKQNELTFAAADAFIAAREVQLEGSRRMTEDQFLRGHSPRALSS
ncbi:MAG: methionyl-tRNA formyltransferase [Verrucomicrobia bacterium]|nr:methionyl-tRNA formyltransferase [Verrucomicrobiota bacterium]